MDSCFDLLSAKLTYGFTVVFQYSLRLPLDFKHNSRSIITLIKLLASQLVGCFFSERTNIFDWSQNLQIKVMKCQLCISSFSLF